MKCDLLITGLGLSSASRSDCLPLVCLPTVGLSTAPSSGSCCSEAVRSCPTHPLAGLHPRHSPWPCYRLTSLSCAEASYAHVSDDRGMWQISVTGTASSCSKQKLTICLHTFLPGGWTTKQMAVSVYATESVDSACSERELDRKSVV